MPRRYSTPPRPLPPEAHEIIQNELGSFELKRDDPKDPNSGLYELQLGPFGYVDYSTTGDYGRPLPENRLQLTTNPQKIVGVPPEELIKIGRQIIEVREQMQGLGYEYELWEEIEDEYAAQFPKGSVDVDALAAEIKKVKDKFGNWKW